MYSKHRNHLLNVDLDANQLDTLQCKVCTCFNIKFDVKFKVYSSILTGKLQNLRTKTNSPNFWASLKKFSSFKNEQKD